MRNPELQTVKQRYNIVGNCEGLNRALDVALQMAPTDLSVLIVGESGVGKEIILIVPAQHIGSFTVFQFFSASHANNLHVYARVFKKHIFILADIGDAAILLESGF